MVSEFDEKIPSVSSCGVSVSSCGVSVWLWRISSFGYNKKVFQYEMLNYINSFLQMIQIYPL